MFQIARNVCVAVAVAAGSGVANANLLVNGSFEQDPSSVVANGVYQDYGAWIRLAPGTTYLLSLIHI